MTTTFFRRFAPVGSLHHYRKLHEEQALGDYHLLLAHKVLQEPDAWETFYKDFRRTIPEPFVIMDNSMVELGKPLRVEAVAEASHIVDASCIVLADVLTKTDETIRLSAEMHDALKQRGDTRPLMGVVQGKALGALDECAQFFCGALQVDFLCVPRVVANTLGSRKDAIELVQMRNRPIHLLGFSDHKVDDIRCAKMLGVMGIDSAEPVWRGLKETPFELGLDENVRPRRFLEDTGYTPMVGANVRSVRGLIET